MSFLICASPISKNYFIQEAGFNSQFQQTNISYISWWCNLVNTVVSSQNNKLTTEQATSGLLKSFEKQAQDKAAKQALPSEPNEPAEPNDVETETTIEELLGPPPEAEIEDI